MRPDNMLHDMQPDNMQPDNVQPDNQLEDQRHYALSKVSEAARVIALAVQELPGMRYKMESLMAVNRDRAKIIYEDIQKTLLRLTGSLTQAYLSLEEMEETDLAAYTLKLIGSVKAFKVMTPDYSRLCGVLTEYVKRLPSQSRTTSAKVNFPRFSKEYGMHP